MFEQLTEKIFDVLNRVAGGKKITEESVSEALRDVRLSLLEADVNFTVVNEFTNAVKSRALGEEVIKNVTPGQQFVKICYEELVKILGSGAVALNLSKRKPNIIMMVGLQGTGKTTTAGKLANKLQKDGRRPYLLPADVYRPAAIDQVRKLAGDLNIPVYPTETSDNPVKVAGRAIKEAEKAGCDVLIIDTAGRLHIDDQLMNELRKIREKVEPDEILLVADAMTGQDAVNSAKAFNDALDISGVILTKVDGDTRGGAALSIKSVTGKPIKFLGVGERMEDLDVFHPDRIASSILGMGDILSLVEKAQESLDMEKAEALRKKFVKNQFNLDDFREQILQMKKIGSFESILKMIPGMGKLAKNLGDMESVTKKLDRQVAIINSMTPRERNNFHIIDPSRKRRIASGSGVALQEVNELLSNFKKIQKMMKQVNKADPYQLMKQLGMSM